MRVTLVDTVSRVKEFGVIFLFLFWQNSLTSEFDYAKVPSMNKHMNPITINGLLTPAQVMLLTFRFNGGSVQDAEAVFQMNRIAVRMMEAGAMNMLREAGHNDEAIRMHFMA